MRRLRDTAHELADRALAVLLAGGWAAALARRAGLQGGIELRELTLRVRRARGAPPLRIAFASDFHTGPATHARQLNRAVETLTRIRPDALLLGGDFVSL